MQACILSFIKHHKFMSLENRLSLRASSTRLGFHLCARLSKKAAVTTVIHFFLKLPGKKIQQTNFLRERLFLHLQPKIDQILKCSLKFYPFTIFSRTNHIEMVNFVNEMCHQGQAAQWFKI